MNCCVIIDAYPTLGYCISVDCLKKSVLLTGMKHCGKSSTGKILAKVFDTEFTDIDDIAEVIYHADAGTALSSREIYRKGGKELFQQYELFASNRITADAQSCNLIAAAGGGICDNSGAIEILKTEFLFVYIHEEADILYERIIAGGLPAFLSNEDPYNDFIRLYRTRTADYDEICNLRINADGRSPAGIVEIIKNRLLEEGYAG